MGDYCLVGKEFQFGRMKKILEIDGGHDGTQTIDVLNATEWYTLNC